MQPLPKLSWFPLYVEKILSSPAWLQMTDYQRGWYIQILLLAAHSAQPGYLPLDGSLWRLAGARTKQFFDQESAVVLACFKRIQMDGRDWIYNERLLTVLQEQARRMQPSLRRGEKNSGKPEEEQKELPFSSSSSSEVSNEVLTNSVQELFKFYCQVFNKDSRYKLTESRKCACAARLSEYLAENSGDLAAAGAAARLAIENLSHSEFHVSHGYVDWNDHIFKTQEIFHKRLEMKIASKPLQAGTRAGAFGDPEFGKNDHLDEWLFGNGGATADLELANRKILRQLQRERDPLSLPETG
jgi:hypothetical protein